MSSRPSVKPGQSVPRKTTLHFVASTVAAERHDMDTQDSDMVHPDADEVDTSEVKLIQRKPMGLGELIAAHQGRGRPPRGEHLFAERGNLKGLKLFDTFRQGPSPIVWGSILSLIHLTQS
jgi:hypothetical protein